jgi:ArsR family transcriptional regulator
VTLSETFERLDHERINRRARIFKIMGDMNRQRILDLLRQGELCQCEIIPEINQSQPTISRHLGLMEEAGVLVKRKEGTKVFYSVSHPGIIEILDWVDKIVDQSEGF